MSDANKFFTPAVIYGLFKQAARAGGTAADEFAEVAQNSTLVDDTKSQVAAVAGSGRLDDPSWHAPINIDRNAQDVDALTSKESAFGSMMLRGAQAVGSRLGGVAAQGVKRTGGAALNLARGAAGVTGKDVSSKAAIGTAIDTGVSIASAANPQNAKVQNAALAIGGGNALRGASGALGSRLTKKV